MSLNIKEITETFEFNKEDLNGNRMLTNEIMVDDIMLGLGYNKRRDKSVQRLYGKSIDWVVCTNSGKKLAIKVLSYDETVDTAEDMGDTLNYCAEARYSLLIVITGIALTILRYSKEELKYNKIKDISLVSDLSEQDEKLINSISKESFDLDFIDSCLKPSFTYEQLLGALNNNKEYLASAVEEIIQKEAGDIEEIEQLTSQFMSNIFDSSEGVLIEQVASHSDTEEINELKATINSLTEELNNVTADNTTLTEENKTLKEQNEHYKEQHSVDTNTIYELKLEAQESDASKSDTENSVVEELSSKVEELKHNITILEAQVQLEKANSEKLKEESYSHVMEVQSLQEQVEAKDSEIATLQEQLESKSTTTSNTLGSEGISEEAQRRIDDYITQIRDLTVKVSEAEEARDAALEKVVEMQKEVDGLSGSDLRFAERLLESIEDDKDDERSYVAVINKELLNYEDIHTFIGRCLQKLYEIKSYDASQFIFNGDIFKMDINSRFNDIVMNNKTYDVILSSDNENEELNKLRVVFSHFDDVVFVCKKIGTSTKHINFRYDIPEEHDEIQLESDEYLSEAYEDNGTNSGKEIFDPDAGVNFGGEQYENVEQYGDMEEGAIQFDANTEDTFGNQDNIVFGQDGSSFEQDGIPMEQGGMQYGEEAQYGNSMQGESPIPYFDDGLEAEQGPVMERRLLVGQLLNIDMLIWSEENIKFNTIKYISTNIITFGINTQDESYDKLLCKCIDAILAIEAFNGSKDLVNTLKKKDFSTANNFLKLYSPEYAQYPRINGTKYVVAGIESVQQVAAALLDICNVMNIDTEEIFLYFDAETSSQFIIENYDFDENAIRIAETTFYVPDEEAQPNQAIAIIKGDMFNHIVITKNSLKVHKEVFNKALAVKTKYLGIVLDTEEKPYEVLCDMITTARNNGIQVDYKAIGNVIGENYLLVSDNEQRVGESHTVYNIFGEDIYISLIESWQVVHALIKAHNALFNDTAIAVKSNVNADAINFYGNQFETSEPSLGLAVNSFVDYVASCVKE